MVRNRGIAVQNRDRVEVWKEEHMRTRVFLATVSVFFFLDIPTF